MLLQGLGTSWLVEKGMSQIYPSNNIEEDSEGRLVDDPKPGALVPSM
jgi:hypothetical protein